MAGAGQEKYRPYPAYKASGVEWLGDIPEGWETMKLSYAVKLQSGDTITSESIKETSDFAVYGGNGQRGFTTTYNCDGHFALIGRQGALCGNVNVAEGKFFASEHAIVVYQRQPFALRFLAEFLWFMNLGQYSVSAAQPGVSVERLNDLKIIKVPLPEQTKIAAFLDHETAKIDELIAKQQRLIALLEEKRQAVISHAVTKGLDPTAPLRPSGIDWLGDVPEHWEVCQVKHIYKNLDSIRVPLSTLERAEMQGEYRYYGASGVIDHVDDYLFDEPLVLVSEDGANLLARSTPIAFVAEGKYWVNNHAHILRPVDKNVEFWAEAIENNNLTPFVTGSAQPKFTSEALSNLPIVYPKDGTERHQINAHIVSQKAKYKYALSKAQSAISLLKERRTALISAAVTGKIDLRDWQAPDATSDISTQDITQNEEALA
jgi:type I restriction enzyme S subunit